MGERLGRKVKMKMLGKDFKVDPIEVEENKKNLLERIALNKSYGYDRVKTRGFIMQKAGVIKGKVLEIGTGKGYLTSALTKKAKTVVSVDISKEGQKFAVLNVADEGNLDNVEFVVCDAAKLSYPDNFFDLVVSAQAFHHFESPFAVLKEMIRVCANKLIIADFNEDGFKIVRKIHQSEGHEHEEKDGDFNIVGLYLKEHGFTVKKFDKYCQIVYVGQKTGACK